MLNTPLPRLSTDSIGGLSSPTVNWNHTRLRLQNLVFCGANACSDRKVMQLAGYLSRPRPDAVCAPSPRISTVSELPTNVTCGAGTIIHDRYGSPSLPFGSSPAEARRPRETQRFGESRLPEISVFFPCSGTPPPPRPITGCENPAAVLVPAPGLEFDRFRSAYRGIRYVHLRFARVETRPLSRSENPPRV